MKCPKCGYLGFETSDRCKLCGYDFSLSAPDDAHVPRGEGVASLEDGLQGDGFRSPEAAAAGGIFDDADLLWGQSGPPHRGMAPTPDGWLGELDRAVAQAPAPGVTPAPGGAVPQPLPVAEVPPVAAGYTAPSAAPPALAPGASSYAASPAPPAMFRGGQAETRASVPDLASLPLFLANTGDDRPLLTVPARPRQPLAVRRTPDTPRLRVLPHAEVAEPVLDFRDEPAPAAVAAVHRDEGPLTELVAGRRLVAAAIDLAILLGIDAAVLYFTLRMTGLTSAEALTVPLVPFGVFLAMVKVGYFAAFTAVGGQTIGKMAAGIRVVSGDLRPVAGAVAVRRTLASILDVLTCGLAYLPALVGPDRRAVHDRLAGTRVVARQQA